MSLSRISALLIGASAFALSMHPAGQTAQAQEAEVTSLSGEVTGARSAGAILEVRLVQTGQTARVTPAGRFEFSNLDPGVYDLEIIANETVLERRRVVVSADAPSTLAIDLDSRTLETVIVVGRRAAIQSAAALERGADGLVAVVTSDDIGNFGDPTVAESLQRIPGLSINREGGEGQQVSIRGLPTEFATVTLDGVRLGSSDAGINSTNLDFFSADNLSQIEVSKTLIAEMDADAIAGSVDLKTISALSRGENSFSARAEYGYQEKAEAWNPKLSGDFTRIFDLPNGSRIGLAAGVNWSSRELITDRAEVGDGLNFFTLEQRTNGRLEYYQGGDVDNCSDVQRAGGTILECYLIPVQLDLRSEEEKKERLSFTGQAEWEVGQSLFQFRGSYADNSEENYVNRVTFDLSRSDGDVATGVGTDDPDVDEVVDIGVDPQGRLFGLFEDGRSERRLRPGVIDEKVYTIGFEGTTDFGDAWTLNYGADYSSNKREDEESEGRFRSDNITQDFSGLSRDGIMIALSREVFDADDDDLDPTLPSGYPIRPETINGETFGTPNQQFATSEDSFETYYANLERRFDFFGREANLKVGAKQRSRERLYDFTRIEYLVSPDISLADFNTTPRADRSIFFIPNDVERGAVLSALDDIIASGRVATEADRGIFLTIENLQDDFTAAEDVTAGFVQVKFEPVEALEVIAGVRAESTDYFTTGSAVRQLEYSDDISEALEVALENGGVSGAQIDQFLLGRDNRSVIEDREGSNDYTEWFPSLSLKWDAGNDIVLRASYSEGLKRPEFREAAAIQFLSTTEVTDSDLICSLLIDGTADTTECPNDIGTLGAALGSVAEAQALLDSARALDLTAGRTAFETEADPARNPFLEPLTSQNFDASLAWYPNPETVLSLAVFHKKIDNFIVPITLTGDDVQRLGFLPDDGTETSLGISRIDTFANGDTAEISGVELSYYQAYTFLPGLLSGLYTQGNVTFADSSASSDLVDRDFQFPDQSDVIGNLSVGWENEVFSFRTAMAYQGERLRGINIGGLEDGTVETAGDELEDARTQFDINVRWTVREGIQLYFDAINITDAEDNRFFRGSSETLNGSFFSALENYGATYQLGVRARF